MSIDLYNQYVIHIGRINTYLKDLKTVNSLPIDQQWEKHNESIKDIADLEESGDLFPEKIVSEIDNESGLKALRLFDVDSSIELNINSVIETRQFHIDTGSAMLKFSETPIFHLIEPVVERLKEDIIVHNLHIQNFIPRMISFYELIKTNPSFSELKDQYRILFNEKKQFQLRIVDTLKILSEHAALFNIDLPMD